MPFSMAFPVSLSMSLHDSSSSSQSEAVVPFIPPVLDADRAADLAGALLPEIDRLILKRNPVVLGSGIRLFGTTGATIQRFRLVGSRAFESGVVIEEYARAIR